MVNGIKASPIYLIENQVLREKLGKSLEAAGAEAAALQIVQRGKLFWDFA